MDTYINTDVNMKTRRRKYMCIDVYTHADTYKFECGYKCNYEHNMNINRHITITQTCVYIDIHVCTHTYYAVVHDVGLSSGHVGPVSALLMDATLKWLGTKGVVIRCISLRVQVRE